MIRHHGPGFQVPHSLLCKGQQHPFQEVTFSGCIKKVLLVERAAGDDIDSVLTETVHGRVRPILRRKLGRGCRVSRWQSERVGWPWVGRRIEVHGESMSRAIEPANEN